MTRSALQCVNPFSSRAADVFHYFTYIISATVFKKGDKEGDKEEPGNYRGITLLSVVGKVFCKILNNRLVEHLDRERALHEGQAGFI